MLQPGRDGKIGRYLRRNDKQWTPATLITFDTETHRIDRPDGEDQPLRLWCARFDDRRQPRRGLQDNIRSRGKTGLELAQAINAWVKGRESTWLYAHSLGYDLFTSQLVDYLCALGWEVDHCSTIPEYVFLVLARGRHRLTLTDLHHLIPQSLRDIGDLIGVPKGTLPPDGTTDEIMFDYCARDVDVLAAAVLQLMAYWDSAGLGNWALSGAACGFHAMRHTLLARAVTLIEDPSSSLNERAAIYGGRRSCWRWGPQPSGRYSELDFTAAHATVMASHPMPVKRGTWFDQLDPHHMAVDGRLAVVIAACEIETDVPRFPCRVDGRVWYPIGRFWTTLASPEIKWARDLGCLRQIGRGQFHYTASVYQPFFNQVLTHGAPGNDHCPPLVTAMWKQWGRSVVGKFAQRGYVIRPTRMLTCKHWFYERAIDDATGREYWLIHYAGRIWEAREAGDGSQAYPAVLALVESHERVALGRVAEMLGPRVIIQCDTDGLWADLTAIEAGTAASLGYDLAGIPREYRIEMALDLLNHQTAPLRLREKHSVDRLAIFGPQNYDAGPHSKHAGRPSRLKEVQPGIWAGDIFPRIARQMANSQPGVYRTEAVSWTRPANVIPGWVLDSGDVAPVEVSTSAGGETSLTPWAQTRSARAGHQLAAIQHQALTGLWTPPNTHQGANSDTSPT